MLPNNVKVCLGSVDPMNAHPKAVTKVPRYSSRYLGVATSFHLTTSKRLDGFELLTRDECMKLSRLFSDLVGVYATIGEFDECPSQGRDKSPNILLNIWESRSLPFHSTTSKRLDGFKVLRMHRLSLETI